MATRVQVVLVYPKAAQIINRAHPNIILKEVVITALTNDLIRSRRRAYRRLGATCIGPLRHTDATTPPGIKTAFTRKHPQMGDVALARKPYGGVALKKVLCRRLSGPFARFAAIKCG